MKATDMLNEVKKLIGVEASVEVKLAQAELENGTIIESEAFEPNSEVFIVTEDERVALPVGEYKLIDGETLIVENEGIIASIGAVEPAEEEVEAEDEPKEEMAYATKEELQEVKTMVEEIKALLDPKEEEMAEEPVADNSVKSEETTTKTVYAEKEEMSEVQKVSHNPESETKNNTNLYSQKRNGNTLDKVMNRISNFK
tara:strand:- start:653 stop:1249 length:597 start_codon:yes stop_codon:yes gene_type:complete